MPIINYGLTLRQVPQKGYIHMSDSVYMRTGSSDMSRNAFYLTIGGILVWGFIATAFASSLTKAWEPNIWVFLIVGLGLPILGIVMSAKLGALGSFIGFNLVAIPFGLILGPVLAAYEVADPGVVGEAAILTAIVTGVMTVTGFLFPSFYSKIGGALFTALLVLLGVSVATLFMPELFHLTWIHYVAAGVFALYIGYDMYRASTMPATLDNAVDVSVSLYLDIINLFLRIMRIRKN